MLTDQVLIHFKTDVKHFYKALVGKLVERSSLTYELVNKLDSLNPHTIANRSLSTLGKKFEGVLMYLNDAKLMTVDRCDDGKREYKLFVEKTKQDYHEEPKDFDVKTDRLDDFFKNACPSNDFPMMWNILEIVFILSCGNAEVERGFSVNKDILKDNMSRETRGSSNYLQFRSGL